MTPAPAGAAEWDGQAGTVPIRPAGFAPGLIAAKPEKPYDGAVFGAFYSLLKKERNAASRALVWLRMGLLRPKRGIAWAHCLSAPSGRIVWVVNRAKPPDRRNQAPPQARLSLPPALRKPSLISLPV